MLQECLDQTQMNLAAPRQTSEATPPRFGLANQGAAPGQVHVAGTESSAVWEARVSILRTQSGSCYSPAGEHVPVLFILNSLMLCEEIQCKNSCTCVVSSLLLLRKFRELARFILCKNKQTATSI